MYPTDVTEVQWEVLHGLIPSQAGRGRRRTVDLRRIVNALLYGNRTGCQWRMIPREYGGWTTVRYYFDKWTVDGTWRRLNAALVEQVRLRAGRAAQPSAAIIDSQSAKTTEAGGARGYDAHTKSKRTQAAGAGGHAGQSRGAEGAAG